MHDTPGRPTRDRSWNVGICPVSVNRGFERILARFDETGSPTDMDLPGFRLHPLNGDQAGYRAVRVPGDRRIVFRLGGDDARDVDLVDHHQ
ncbi:MAG: hypothetical protein OXF88_17350 [Rhodobacteraceae bacterium]|nr:hypothetical protein [Paracoccaceae bacterium]